MRRRRVIYLVFALPVLILAACLLLGGSSTGVTITPDTFGRVQDGMTMEEVAGIMGGPADNANGPQQGKIWLGREAVVHVFFDDSGKAYKKLYSEQPPYYRLQMGWRKIVSYFL